ASNYLWFTPNDCNNMHSCRESIGDTYMSVLVPKILNRTVFRTTRAALFITFDEGYRFPTYAVWVGPLVKTAYASSYGYTHYSVLATIESNWNLSPLTSNDRDAPHMGEFFLGQPSRGFRNPPPHPLPLAYVAAISGSGAVAVIVTGAILLRREKRRSSELAASSAACSPCTCRPCFRASWRSDDHWMLLDRRSVTENGRKRFLTCCLFSFLHVAAQPKAPTSYAFPDTARLSLWRRAPFSDPIDRAMYNSRYNL